MVAGKADTDPLFPDNPQMAPNRRVTITLMKEAPPLRLGLRPKPLKTLQNWLRGTA
jgi:chemotaxis protein MotB